MIKKYAMLKDNIIINMVLWDGVIRSDENPNAWEPPEGFVVMDIEGISCDIGWVWNGETFENQNS